jgi:transposase
VSKRSKYTAEEKYDILMEYENGMGSIQDIVTKHSICVTTLYDWKYNFRKYGLDGLKESRGWKRYSKELKERAVQDYISGKCSQGEIVKLYEIADRSVLKRWINSYNSHRELLGTTKGMRQPMTKGRNTSWKEKIEIVLYCIANKSDYHGTAELYNVSYQQVYQWFKKYEIGGEAALTDRRGRNKAEDELTDEQKTKLAMKKLEIENERLRAENAFLKKLEELEGRRY